MINTIQEYFIGHLILYAKYSDPAMQLITLKFAMEYKRQEPKGVCNAQGGYLERLNDSRVAKLPQGLHRGAESFLAIRAIRGKSTIHIVTP